MNQVREEEARRLLEGEDALLGPLGARQRDLSRDVIKPTVGVVAPVDMSHFAGCCTVPSGARQAGSTSRLSPGSSARHSHLGGMPHFNHFSDSHKRPCRLKNTWTLATRAAPPRSAPAW